MSKIVNHPTHEQIMEFASLPYRKFERGEFSDNLALSVHFANCEKCRNLKNDMVVFLEKYDRIISSMTKDDAYGNLTELVERYCGKREEKVVGGQFGRCKEREDVFVRDCAFDAVDCGDFGTMNFESKKFE